VDEVARLLHDHHEHGLAFLHQVVQDSVESNQVFFGQLRESHGSGAAADWITCSGICE
jgi:hypothetical protein